MSNKRVIVGGIIVVSLVVTLFLPVAIRQIAQRQISSVAPGAAVRISRCTVNPFSTISFYGLTVQRPFFYDLSVGELTIRYDLMRGRVRLVEVKDASVAVTAPKESIGSLTGLVRLGKGGGIPVDELAFSGIGVSCDTQDLGGELRIDSLRYALGSGSVEAIDAAVDSLRYTGLHLRDARISCALGKAPGRLSVAEVSYDKLKVREIASALRLEKNTAYLDGLTLGVFGGTIEGSLAFALTAPFSYTVTINAAQIDIEAAVSDFNLAEKFQMTGRANGAIALSGAGTAVRSLAGDLASVAPGGSW